MILAVVDPGKKVAGVAVFLDGYLAGCRLIRADSPLKLGIDTAAYLNAVKDYDVLVTEGQEVYPGRRRSNPNDLLPLAFMCGVVHATVRAAKRVSVPPRLWTKGTPKKIRLARVEAALSPEEAEVLRTVKCPKSLRHNVVDSIALGKWYLARGSK